MAGCSTWEERSLPESAAKDLRAESMGNLMGKVDQDVRAIGNQ